MTDDERRAYATIAGQIIALEAAQARPLRELALGSTPALARLQTIDNQITALRKQLT